MNTTKPLKPGDQVGTLEIVSWTPEEVTYLRPGRPFPYACHPSLIDVLGATPEEQAQWPSVQLHRTLKAKRLIEQQA